MLKRPLDFVLATIGLLLSSPLWLIIALAIKLYDGGPIFFSQVRWGKRGRKFRVFKFRTMIVHADSQDGPRQARERDGRVTRIGAFLRATGMDELPQLASIWVGRMSLVGPRALAVGEIVVDADGRRINYEQVRGFYERLAVRPGLTGVATIFLPKDAHPRRKFRYDLFYIRRQSFWFDVRLIALSLWISVRGRWETRAGKV
jgi:lipopolysaccharide/colanic/teichoic acid biosynthesis glycosyltransferase